MGEADIVADGVADGVALGVAVGDTACSLTVRLRYTHCGELSASTDEIII